MTKFDELMDIITHNENKARKTKKIIANDEQDDDDEIELEVSGAEIKALATANEELDPDIIDMLYTKPRHVPNRGENASSWDSDY